MEGTKIVKSAVAITVLEALENIGIVNKLNLNGYHITIYGIEDNSTRNEEDSPYIHRVIIERNKFIEIGNKGKFNKLANKVEDVINNQEKDNIDFEDTDTLSIKHQISIDKSNYIWYKHSVEGDIKRSILETEEAYLERLFHYIANYVIDTFNSMLLESEV